MQRSLLLFENSIKSAPIKKSPREHFPKGTKELTLKKQGRKCAKCGISGRLQVKTTTSTSFIN